MDGLYVREGEKQGNETHIYEIKSGLDGRRAGHLWYIPSII